MKKTLVILTGILFCFAWLTYCNSNRTKRFTDKRSEEGFLLAERYCKSCHLLPEPELLNKATWANFVLPKMSEMVGYRHLGMNHYVQTSNEPTLKPDQWDKIIHYYLSEAPVEPLKRAESTPDIKIGLKYFEPEIPSFSNGQPVTTMVKIDTGSRLVYWGDGLSGRLYKTRANSVLVDSVAVGTGISQLLVRNNELLALTMGVLVPSDLKLGELKSIDGKMDKTDILLDSLQRPVQASIADLNGDGREDLIMCEFGNLSGQLCWYEKKETGGYTRHVLRQLPGAIRNVVDDFDKDGRPDIMALMAQGDEGIFIYYNQGNGKFREERILQFPPAYGSNYFELADMNGDGFSDIVATNGDNGDYPPILKAYHGIRIYLNNGQNKFKEKLFLPMNGAGKAIANDYDGDGDMDIASISFFPDRAATPEEGFVFWENNGDLDFAPYSFKEVTYGNWITMDAGDIEGDGDIDLVIGSADFGMGDAIAPAKTGNSTPSFIILYNKTR